MKNPKTILSRTRTFAAGLAAAGGMTAAATIEAELAELLAQRDRLSGRLATATETVDAANTTRRLVLLAESIDDAALARAEAQCRAANDAHAGLEDALRHLSVKIEDAQRRIANAADSVERDRVATELEARAARIVTASVNLDRAAEAFDEVRAELVRVCWADAPRDPLTGFPQDGLIVRGAGRLAGIIPRSEGDNIMSLPVSAYGAAHRLCEGMKAQAAAIRAGTAPAVLPTVPEPYRAVTVSDVPIVLSRPVRYGGLHGQVETFAGGQMLPKPVADAAIAKGIGFDMESADGQAILRVMAREPYTTVLKRLDSGQWVKDRGEPSEEHGNRIISPETWLPIDVNLNAYAIAERARMGAAA